MKLLVTGGAGFIGSNFIRYMLGTHQDYSVVNFDKLTYAGNPANLADLDEDPRYSFVKADICDAEAVKKAVDGTGVDAVINFAAETHVDRSIDEPRAFLETDIIGTQILLDAVRDYGVGRYIQISTDEVYGDWEGGGFASESSLLRPSSPYAASKTGGDLQVLAYHRTYGLPVIITRCTNNYGPYQYPEKVLPLFITNLLEGNAVPVYGDGGQIRDWLYVDDHCSAIDLILQQGKPGSVYNIGANHDPEVTNLDLTKMVLDALGLGAEMMTHVTDRKGHDRRYAVDCSKIKAMGWAPKVTLEEGLRKTIAWYRDNRDWWEKIKSGDFKEYYLKMYGSR